MPQVRLAATLKATGLNIHRATVFRNRQKRYKQGKKSNDSPCNSLILSVREQLEKHMGHLKAIIGKICPDNYLPAGFLSATA
jgi:hypothetical protein